ncbi:MAG: phosphoribosylanthranilate isomerase [Acidobacteria bacterium]|nr:phosphoribosylanthranilate isomerase [Acidobacteriota bacterium]
MTKVKICGITNLEDALLSAKFGADALGFNFYEKSPRYIAPEKAREIIKELPAHVLIVGVFVNESLNKIIEIAATAKLGAIQLHGEETPEFARELKAKTNFEIIKAFRVSPEFKPENVLQYEVDAILLDAYSQHEHGGTGETFDWKFAKKVQKIFPKMYLAGGISKENIRTVMRLLNPFAVDTCSRIEIEKGKKDKIKLINLILTARNFEKVNSFFQSGSEKIRNIYDLLDAIQPHPKRFIGENSLSSLRKHLGGIKISSEVLEKKYDEKGFYHLDWEDSDFTNYVAKQLSQNVGAKDWSYLILEAENFDEEKALDRFFALLEEFKLEKEDLGND